MRDFLVTRIGLAMARPDLIENLAIDRLGGGGQMPPHALRQIDIGFIGHDNRSRETARRTEEPTSRLFFYGDGARLSLIGVNRGRTA